MPRMVNVGGQNFTMGMDTFRQCGELCQKLADSDIPAGRDNDGNIFLDRDPGLFEWVLRYVRTGEVAKDAPGPLKAEFDYLQLPWPSCCQACGTYFNPLKNSDFSCLGNVGVPGEGEARGCKRRKHRSSFSLAVKTLTGKSVFLQVDDGSTVDNMKLQIQDQTGIPPDQVCLVLVREGMAPPRGLSFGDELPEGITHLHSGPMLAEHQLAGHQVHVVLRLRMIGSFEAPSNKPGAAILAGREAPSATSAKYLLKTLGWSQAIFRVCNRQKSCQMVVFTRHSFVIWTPSTTHLPKKH
eukprot:TRINITY_DN106116_c0_g1_i1.p1 TRINITY_DN106116_c0_g1~~TRINITY_DN106116_c0_g1_i1.p1  ORF type:complete len:296 (-),score=49.01 TRINITY_DN106116_c0_g1_i1:522-1409(-)